MVSGELIRLKSLVDDCVRVMRTIQREYKRLEASEQGELASYIRSVVPKIEEVFPPPAEAGKEK
jgi:hypothetical protein